MLLDKELGTPRALIGAKNIKSVDKETQCNERKAVMCNVPCGPGEVEMKIRSPR